MTDSTATPAADPRDGTVEWDKAAARLTGEAATSPDADAGPDGEGSETPELVDVSIRGRKVKMLPEDAEAYKALIKDFRDRDGRLGGELQALKDRVAKSETGLAAVAKVATQASAPKPPDIKLAEEDFAAYHQQMLEYQDARERQLRAELLDRAEATQAPAATTRDEGAEWVTGFFRRHEHLGDEATRTIVQAAYNKNQSEIEALRRIDPEGAQDRLAELVDETIVAARARRTTSNAARPPRLEGAGSPPAAKTTVEKPVEPLSAATWSAKKRAALRGATK